MTQDELNKRLDLVNLGAGPSVPGWNARYRAALRDQGLKLTFDVDPAGPRAYAPDPYPGDRGKDDWPLYTFVVPA